MQITHTLYGHSAEAIVLTLGRYLGDDEMIKLVRFNLRFLRCFGFTKKERSGLRD